MKYICQKCYKNFFGLIFLGAHTVQAVPKYIWMQHFLYQKKIVQDKWVNLGLKMAHPHNTGSALLIFKKFCRMKGAKRYMKILLVVFWEKKFCWGNLIFLSFRPFFTVWLGMVEIEPGHCYYWILKQSGHDFSGKHLCDGYCMDVMWYLCVEVKIHGFVKLL